MPIQHLVKNAQGSAGLDLAFEVIHAVKISGFLYPDLRCLEGQLLPGGFISILSWFHLLIFTVDLLQFSGGQERYNPICQVL